MNQVVLIFIVILAIWKIHDIIFPEKTKLGRQLVEKIIQSRLQEAFYREFIFSLVKEDSISLSKVDKWLSSEYISWLKKKIETQELSDIINSKD